MGDLFIQLFYYYSFPCNHRNKVIKAILMPRTLLCLWSLVLASGAETHSRTLLHEKWIIHKKRAVLDDLFVIFHIFPAKENSYTHTLTFLQPWKSGFTFQHFVIISRLEEVCNLAPLSFCLMCLFCVRFFLLLAAIAVGNESNTY